jgi:amino acid transporter
MKAFVSGMLGGAVLLGIVTLICLFSLNLHLYNVAILKPKLNDSINIQKNKVELIQDLHNEGTILTPQEYTNNIVSYYNTSITLLVFLFILFSFISYFHLKFLSNEQINKALEEKIKDSKEMERIIMEAFAGKADGKYESIENVDSLRDIIDEMGKRLDARNYDDEEIRDQKIKSDGS